MDFRIFSHLNLWIAISSCRWAIVVLVTSIHKMQTQSIPLTCTQKKRIISRNSTSKARCFTCISTPPSQPYAARVPWVVSSSVKIDPRHLFAWAVASNKRMKWLLVIKILQWITLQWDNNNPWRRYKYRRLRIEETPWEMSMGHQHHYLVRCISK